jgi:hypothetical protein
VILKSYFTECALISPGVFVKTNKILSREWAYPHFWQIVHQTRTMDSPSGIPALCDWVLAKIMNTS